jgi:ArsR family transcriptional regulator
MNIVSIFKALSDENRLRIMNLLIQEELCVCEIEAVLGLSQSNVSRHLNKLKSEKVIDSHKEAQWVHYFISNVFKEDKKVFYEFLIEELKNIPQCLEDTRKLNIYMKSPFTCENIRQDKDSVEDFLNSKMTNN